MSKDKNILKPVPESRAASYYKGSVRVRGLFGKETYSICDMLSLPPVRTQIQSKSVDALRVSQANVRQPSVLGVRLGPMLSNTIRAFRRHYSHKSYP
jgi:hypothetical protein